MKNFLLIIFLFSSPLAYGGSSLFDHVLQTHQEGKCTSFLKEIDNLYRQISKKQVLTQEKIEPLKEQCKRELIEICLEYPNNDLSRDIKNMVFFTPTQKEQESLDFIESLNEKRSLEGTSPLENTLIDINLEFLIKSSLLTEDRKDRMILQLEKLAKMKELCEKEEKIKTYFETAYSISPKTEASCTVKKHLQALGSKQALPQNTMEEEVQAVMIKYAQSRHPTKS